MGKRDGSYVWDLSDWMGGDDEIVDVRCGGKGKCKSFKWDQVYSRAYPQAVKIKVTTGRGQKLDVRVEVYARMSSYRIPPQIEPDFDPSERREIIAMSLVHHASFHLSWYIATIVMQLLIWRRLNHVLEMICGVTLPTHHSVHFSAG